MPTFGSIHIHPLLKARFLGSQGEDDSADSSDRHRHHYQQRLKWRRQPARSRVLIPRSMLTRDLNDLVDMVLIGEIGNESQRDGVLARMESIQYEVAGKMILTTRNGKRLLSQRDRKHMKCKALIQGGSISVQEAWDLQHKMAKKHQNCTHVISTGCSDLDGLVAFPAEYFTQLNGKEDVAKAHCDDSISGEYKGLPTGYVLKLSGTSGKTELAIQLASEAIMQAFQTSKGTKKRVRYCYSTAGHSAYSLAQRLLQLIQDKTDYGEDMMLKDILKTTEFQSITTVSQFVSMMAKLEIELSQHTTLDSSSENDKGSNDEGIVERKPTLSMLVLDAMPFMVFEGEDGMKIDSFERWVKRLARHYSVLVVIVTPSGGGRLSSVQSNKTASDIHIQLQKKSSTTLSIRLMCHPAKPVTERDCITCLLR
mmetsp:Transcript_6339/g.15705  ORF Transcript_6339/g.15705 Transcript_6339/m.15705 type:complete len:424 (-) Transcript_6339:2326-3597(-)